MPYLNAQWRVAEEITLAEMRSSLLEPLEYYYNRIHTPKIPPVTDLITMMVREVFVAERYEELVREYPVEASKWGAWHGFSEYWMKCYWAMHWRLVPLEQLYDMHARGMIDYTTLERFVKYHDIEPLMRKYVIELSWGLPGRIDMRWMFEWAVLIPYREVFGYPVPEYEPLPGATDEEKALTEWIIADRVHPKAAPYVARAWVRNLLREEIMGAFRALARLYREGFRDRSQVEAWAEGQGIPKLRLELYMQRFEWERELEEKEALVKVFITKYKKRRITLDELRAELAKLKMRNWRIDAIVSHLKALAEAEA